MVHSFILFQTLLPQVWITFCPVFQVNENDTDHCKFSCAFYLLFFFLLFFWYFSWCWVGKYPKYCLISLFVLFFNVYYFVTAHYCPSEVWELGLFYFLKCVLYCFPVLALLILYVRCTLIRSSLIVQKISATLSSQIFRLNFLMI